MNSFEFGIDQRDIDRMKRWGEEVADPVIAFKALAAGVRGATAILATETRRQIKRYGLTRGNSLLARSITSVTNTNRRRLRINSRVGARNKKVDGKNPAKYFHMFNNGTRPHFQPNGYLPFVDGGNVSRFYKVEGGRQHPGAEAHPVREPAQRAAAPKIQRRFVERYERTVFKELKKAAAKAQA